MPIYELTQDALVALPATTFAQAKVSERGDLQRVLRQQIDVICPGVLVIAEEFGQWTDSNRRIDLLGVDKDGSLVVIELKRTESGGHMDLQAMRYAAMVSAMTFEQAVGHYETYLRSMGDSAEEAESRLREFLGLGDADDDAENAEEAFGQSVRIVLASAEFGKELTTSVLWLNEQGLDITCVRLRPYSDGQRVMLDVQQIIPLPEAEQFQVKLREKAQKERSAKKSTNDLTKYDLTIDGHTERALPKRQLVYKVVAALIERGAKPVEIVDAAGFRLNNTFRSIPEETTDPDEFNQKLSQIREAEGKSHNPRKFFSAPGELFIVDGATYVLSGGWGKRTAEWINKVLARYPDSGITFRPSDSTGN
jgi:hypothetical protein